HTRDSDAVLGDSDRLPTSRRREDLGRSLVELTSSNSHVVHVTTTGRTAGISATLPTTSGPSEAPHGCCHPTGADSDGPDYCGLRARASGCPLLSTESHWARAVRRVATSGSG